MRRRQNNINLIDESLRKLNELNDTTIYTEQLLTEIFNSKENLKKDILLTQLSKILVRDDMTLFIYKLEKIDLNLLDTNFFKMNYFKNSAFAMFKNISVNTQYFS